MNKKLDVSKNATILFILNIIVLITTIFFRTYYTARKYVDILVNIIFVINIIILLIGIVFNILIVNNSKKYDKPLLPKIIITIIIIYLLLNTVLIIFVNKTLNNGYTKINQKLSSYCDVFGCDKYETITGNQYEEFVIKKTYFDYNGLENELEITTRYNTDKIILIKAIVYSRKDMFSQTLIYDELKDYFYNFKCNIKESKIKEAFDNRITSSIKDGNATYKVTEIYEDDKLEKLKTTITIKLDQE